MEPTIDMPAGFPTRPPREPWSVGGVVMGVVGALLALVVLIGFVNMIGGNPIEDISNPPNQLVGVE